MNALLNFKSFIKFLRKNKSYSFINVFGLSVSLMFVILISVYTWQELSVDRFQEKGDRLYVLANDESLGFAYKLADRLKENFPEIEEVCPMVNVFKKMPISLNGGNLNADLIFTDSTFFQMFSFNLKAGNKGNALEALNYAVISETFANRAFPGEDPLGQLIQINEELIVVVNGVMEDISNSVIPYGDILLRINNVHYYGEGLISDTYNDFGSTPIIMLVNENADIYGKTDAVLSYLKENVWMYREGFSTQVSFVPLKDVYFSSFKGYDGYMFNQGNKSFVLILMSVGLVILIFAIINYVNLTVAQAGFRYKEMATRRLLGSSRKELFIRLIMESTGLIFVATGVALFLAFVFQPFTNDLLDTQLNLKELFTPLPLLILLIGIVLMGTVSGFLPAIVISNAKPVDVVKGTLRTQTKMVFSKFFITFQNAITLALIVTSITMVKQIDHMIKAPLGYNTENIIDIPVDDILNKSQMLTLGNELRQLSTVNRLAYSQGMPFTWGGNQTIRYEDKSYSMQLFRGDTTFVNMLGLQILKENNLASNDGLYLSEHAFRELGLDEDAPTIPFWGADRPIAGKIKDFRLGNVNFESRPTLLWLQKFEDFNPWNLVIEVEGDPWIAYQQVKECYEKVTQLEFNGKFVDQQIAESFAVQAKTSKIVTLFAGIAILLSVLGLLAMSTYFIQQRSREVALRKVFGSSSMQVLKKLVSTFLNYVFIAFIISTPFIWYTMQEWLNGYSYRITLSPMIFLTAGFFCLFVSFITVFWQSLQAANMNPVESIKAE